MTVIVADKPDPGWVKPANPREAILRCIPYIEDPFKWTDGEWFALTPAAERKLRDPEIGPDYSRLTCSDVRACAAGVIIIVCLDGPALRQYYLNGQNLDLEEVILSDPLAKATATLVAEAIVELGYDNATPPRNPRTMPVSVITSFNDQGRGGEHREQIAGAFRYAARAADTIHPQQTTLHLEPEWQ